MDFKNGRQLIELCNTNNCPISQIMLIREETFTERPGEDLLQQMSETWQIMKDSAHFAVEDPKPSMGGLIGGEAKLVSQHRESGKSICKAPLSLAITYSMAVLETSASMGLIVAAPTAGSAGIVPGFFSPFRKLMTSPTATLSLPFLMQGLSAASPCATLPLPAP